MLEKQALGTFAEKIDDDGNGRGVVGRTFLFSTDEDTEGVEKDEAEGKQTTSKDDAIFKFIMSKLGFQNKVFSYLLVALGY